MLNIHLSMSPREAAVQLADHAQSPPPEFTGAERLERRAVAGGRNLTFAYPNGPTALRDLDITSYDGEFVAVLGSNGSGKTTMALLLAGALEPRTRLF